MILKILFAQQQRLQRWRLLKAAILQERPSLTVSYMSTVIPQCMALV